MEEKLAIFDRWAPAAMALICDLMDNPEEAVGIFTLARERHIKGHELYGDKNLIEWDDETLYANFLEEIADAIVYGSHFIERFSREALTELER